MYDIEDIKDAYADVTRYPWPTRQAQDAMLVIIKSLPSLLGEIERLKEMLEQFEFKESVRHRFEDGC